jgi:hypothetical protein
LDFYPRGEAKYFSIGSEANDRKGTRKGTNYSVFTRQLYNHYSQVTWRFLVGVFPPQTSYVIFVEIGGDQKNFGKEKEKDITM